MGQKVNPTGIRLGIVKDHASVWYAERGAYADKLNNDLEVRSFLEERLKNASVSRIHIERPANNARITIHTARPGIVIGKKGEDVDRLRRDLTEMMGVPEEERHHIRMLAEKLLSIGRGEPDRLRQLSDGMRGMDEYVIPMVEERMKKPQDDFISVLANGEKAGVFTREQVLVNTSLLLLAGHETTINLICNGTLAFMENRDQWELLKEDPQGVMVRATEEALRYDAPVKSITRIAAEDVEMRGKRIKKNDRIRWIISSANRDPDKFENADTMDISRWPNPHVAFGSGIHHCLGATIARVEGQEVFSALAERYPNLELATQEREYQSSITFRSMKDLPVSLN